jgi:hypothetical protein
MSLIVGMVVVTYVMYSKTRTWGSMWCWVSNAVAFVLVAQVFWRGVCVAKSE